MSEFSTPPFGFMAFLPKEYQGEFSREWIVGLSPFEDHTCARCFSVRQGQWMSFGMREAEEGFLKCERTV